MIPNLESKAEGRNEKQRERIESQRGGVLVLVAVSLSVMLIMLAFAVDYGRMTLTASELQSAADAAALAGAAQLVDEDCLYGSSNIDNDIVEARSAAEQYAGLNQAGDVNLLLDRNDGNLSNGGVVIGYIDNPLDPNSPFLTESISEYNSVRVVVKLTQDMNGPLGLLFGGATGKNAVEMSAQSTATLDDRVVGFAGYQPSQRSELLPFSLDVAIWDAVFHLAYQPQSSSISDPIGPVIGSIGMNVLLHWLSAPSVVTVPTVKIYPYKADAPGNFGTIDIGSNDNSASVLCDQILYGPTGADMALVGLGELTLNTDLIFTKWFNGDTGMSATLKSAIEQIYNQPRVLPLHRQVLYTGNNAQFEVCRYVGVKIVGMKMTGAEANRYIEVQPTQVVSRHAVINPSAPHSHFLYAMSLTR